MPESVKLKFRISAMDDGKFRVDTHSGGEGFFAGSWSRLCTCDTVEEATTACGEEMLYQWEHRENS
jgi:hypothetical protein